MTWLPNPLRFFERIHGGKCDQFWLWLHLLSLHSRYCQGRARKRTAKKTANAPFCLCLLLALQVLLDNATTKTKKRSRCRNRTRLSTQQCHQKAQPQCPKFKTQHPTAVCQATSSRQGRFQKNPNPSTNVQVRH
jgi:hypothetical protein